MEIGTTTAYRRPTWRDWKRRTIAKRLRNLAKKVGFDIDAPGVQKEAHDAGVSKPVPLLPSLLGTSEAVPKPQNEHIETENPSQNLEQIFSESQAAQLPPPSVGTGNPTTETQTKHAGEQMQLPTFNIIGFTPINPRQTTQQTEKDRIEAHTQDFGNPPAVPSLPPSAGRVTSVATTPRGRIKYIRRRLKLAAKRAITPDECKKELKLAEKQLENFNDIETISLLPHLIESLERPKAVPVSRLPQNDPTLAKSVEQSFCFAGAVIRKSKPKAKRYALDEYKSRGAIPGRTVYWVDASAPQNAAGVAFVFKEDPRYPDSKWTIKGYKVLQKVESNYAELLAILLAMEHVEARAVASQNSIKVVAIYTDSTNAQHSINNFGRASKSSWKFHPLAERVVRLSGSLMSLGVAVELHWVPGHSGVPGNHVADRVAYRAARAKESK